MTNQPKAPPWEQFATNIRPERAKEQTKSKQFWRNSLQRKESTKAE